MRPERRAKVVDTLGAIGLYEQLHKGPRLRGVHKVGRYLLGSRSTKVPGTEASVMAAGLGENLPTWYVPLFLLDQRALHVTMTRTHDGKEPVALGGELEAINALLEIFLVQ